MTIKEVKINTMSELYENLFNTYEYNPMIRRYRSLKLFRGIPNKNFKLLTSLNRICKEKAGALEPSILDNFAKYAELQDASIKESVWRKMILGQHHGLPTRLLDWTRSPLMALHFAMTDNLDMMDKQDCAVWCLDVEKLHEGLPERYQKEIKEKGQKIFTVDMLQDVCGDLNTYDADMGKENMVIMEPPSMDERMMNQYSFFAVLPSNVKNAEEVFKYHEDAVTKYIIDKNIRWEIRDFLDQANINERIVYPGLDGIAQWLSRHYFVRDVTRLHIEKENIVSSRANVWVNSTNSSLSEIGQVCESIFKAIGEEEMKAACAAEYEENGPFEEGQFAVTEKVNNKETVVIHAVAPVYDSGKEQDFIEAEKKLYSDILNWVKDHELHSVAFPLLSAGKHHCPLNTAWNAAVDSCKDFLDQNKDYPMDIEFCVLDEDTYVIGQNTYNEKYGIDSKVPAPVRKKYSRRRTE